MCNPTLSETVYGLLDPWIFIWYSITYLPPTVLRLLREGDLRTLLSPSRLQAAWFGAFWAFAGPGVREGNEEMVVPLLRGRVHDGCVFPEGGGQSESSQPLHPPVSGTVLEIGPGSGMWVSMFSDRYLGGGARDGPMTRRRSGVSQQSRAGSRVTRVYGVEPNRDVHPLLQQKIRDAKLEDVYEIVPFGIEDLDSSGRVQKGSVDCIVTVLCLCSIPDPQRNIKELHAYLKPGGRWYVFEHVKCSRPWGIVLYQALLNLFWPIAIGGCELQRETEKWLRDAGPWADIDLARRPNQPWFQTLPRIIGILTK